MIDTQIVTQTPAPSQHPQNELIRFAMSYLSHVYTVQTNPGSTRASFCRVNTANPGSTRVSLEKYRVNTTWDSFNPGRTRVRPGLVCAV